MPSLTPTAPPAEPFDASGAGQFFTDWWQRFKFDIAVAWPETMAIELVTQAQRTNWSNLLELEERTGRAQVGLPLVVVELGEMNGGTTEEWTANAIVLRQRVTVYYVFQGSGTSVASDLVRKLSALLMYLAGTDQGGTCTLLLDNVQIDVTEANPMVQILLGRSLPLDAGSVAFDVLIGVMIEDVPTEQQPTYGA